MSQYVISKQQGFTLIELLIALFISIIIGVATIGFMVYSQKSHAVQEQVSDTQQNVRIAMDQMTRDIRLAGNWNNVFFTTNCEAILRVSCEAPNLEPAKEAALALAPCLDACENCAMYGVPAWKAEADAVRVVYADNNCPDSFIVDRPGQADPANTFFLCVPNPLPAICNAGGGFPFAVNDLVLVVGDLGSTYIQVATINNVGEVGCGEGYNRVRVTYPPGQSVVNDPNGIAEVGENPRAHRASTGSKIYYVDSNDNLRVRYRRGNDVVDVVLATNVEDLQVRYMLSDGAIVHNPEPCDIQNVRNVRINLLTRTASTDPLFTGTRPALENHVAGPEETPAPRRRILQEEIRVRNLMD